jgi:methyltransferase (TIGR00027 family)
VPLLLWFALRIGDRLERGVGAYIPLRTAYIDDEVTRAARADLTQIVILGAGYDSRPWRLAHRRLRFFEVDHPATQRHKRAAITRIGLHARSTLVPVDFGTDDLSARLCASGFDRTRPTLFIWEGVTMFLPPAAVRETLVSIRSLAAPGSRMVADFNYPKADTLGCSAARALGEPCRFSLEPEDATALLGMHVVEVAGADVLRRRYLIGTRFARRHRAQPSFLVTARAA